MEGEKKRYWMGDAPTRCQLTDRTITTQFVDGRVPGVGGPWGYMHPAEYKRNGGTFGTGRGQLYEKQTDGRWLKVEG